MKTMTKPLTRDATVDEVVEALERDGYCVVERLLDTEEAAAMRSGLREVLDATPNGRNDFEGYKTKRIYALFAKTRAFDGPATHPLLLGVLDRILGGGYQLSAPVGIEIGPGETAQNLHTDDIIYPVKKPHQHLVLNTMWAMDDFTEANGATRLVPGSHRWVDERPDDNTEVLIAEMPKGSVMFFVGSLWHGGGTNNSDKPRLGVILEYCSGWLRPQENHVIAVPPNIVRTLPERLQELLGYGIQPPFVGYVDGRHPRKALLRD